MKQYYGDIWIETKENGIVHIGLTNNFIQQKLQECFHIIPADFFSIKENDPMLVVETNEGLESLKSPLSGQVVFFNTQARNFPDKIKEEDVIMKLRPGEIKSKNVATKVTTWPLEFNYTPDNVSFSESLNSLLSRPTSVIVDDQ